MTTGEKIKQLRKREQISQEQLAAILGLSRQAISRWETDNALPETAVILKLSEYFHVTTDYLLKEEDSVLPEPAPHIEAESKSDRRSPNLIIGICGIVIAAAVSFIVLLISALNPMMRDGTSGVLDPNFWKWNELVPFAIIIGIALCVVVYHLGKYYFTEWQPK